MLNKVNICIAILLLLGLTVEGQPPQTQAFLPKVIQASPEAAGIAKFGNYDVNLFTGIPNISIPLYTVQVGELTVPISLNYHASGLKVSEIPSWVGLGWSLSAGGTISRKVMGKADEYDGNYLRPSSNGTVKYTTEINPNTQAGLDYLRFVNQNIYDVEPDIFSYSLPGKGGKFLFNQRDNYNPIIMPFDPIKITKTFPGAATMLMDITDESGILYKFDTYEWTNTSVGGTVTDAISTWMMSQMISSNKQDTINFNYITGYNNDNSYFSDFIVLNDEVVNYSSPGYSPDFGTSYTSTSYVNITSKIPTEIFFKNGKVVFEQASENRPDFSSAQKRLKYIKIYNYDKLSNTYRLLKTIQLYHSISINPTNPRMMLDSVSVSGGGGSEIQKYKFEYNANQLLPGRLSRTVDYWGYYNNANNNTLVPRMEVPYYDNSSTTITIGSNITNGRDPNPTYMQAQILKKVFHPTGGYTEFEYETNQYLDVQSNPYYAGGLRIKKIKNYDGINTNPIVKTYKYGSNESGYGRANFILNNYFFQSSQTNRYFWQGGEGSGCYLCPCLNATKRVRTFFSNPTIDIEPYDGAAVVYPSVTEYIGDETNNIGKTIYQFNDHADGMNVVAGLGRPIITSYHFDRGQLITKDIYKKTGPSSFVKVATISNSYSAFSEQWNSALGLVVLKWRINQGSWTGDDIYAGPEATGCYGDDYSYLFANYSIRTGDNKLTQTTETVYDENDPNKTSVTNTNYYYDNFTHQQVNRIQKTNSKGQTILNTLKYPPDAPYASQLPYSNMITSNIINKVVDDKQTNNGVQLSYQVNNYTDWSGKYLPSSLQLQVGSNTIETRANFLKYDTRGNIQEMQKSNDVKLAYIWDYQKLYPVAEVSGANESDIAYTSFESDGKGNWSFSGLQFTDGSAPTGKKVYNLGTGNITRSSLSTSTTYYVSYWSKSGTQTVSGTSTTTTGRSINGWTRYEHKVVNPSGGTITISGSGIIDELRLYPDKSFMTSMTYEPLIGVTSQCDANNRILYFEYDDINRLMLVRDQDKNVIKKICYKYDGETEYCPIYYNSAQGGNFTRNNCDPGYTGSTVTYTVPANTYGSNVSPTDANNKAIADVNANGQAYANALGTCTAPMVTINGYNAMSSTYQVKFTNNVTGNWYTFYLNPNTYSPYYLGQVPAGTYTVQFYPAGSPVSATHNINGYTQYGGYGATFYNISITATSQAYMY